MGNNARKAVIWTVVLGILFLGLYNYIGYERAELLAFALLAGISIAALKPH
jgi:hypothetical protein